jgi:hypothetical protein
MENWGRRSKENDEDENNEKDMKITPQAAESQ